MSFKNFSIVLAALGALAFVSGCSSESVGSATAPLVATCTNDALEDLLPGDWLCPNELRVECEDGVGDPETIYFEPDANDLPDTPCDNVSLSLVDGENQAGPFPVGTHQIVVTAEASNEGEEPVTVRCESTLIVEDTEPPEIEAKTVELWPPNHKFHTVTAEDCMEVRDRCDDDLEVTFLSASSDEPVNDKGDGNTEPDIVLDCDSVQLRSERQGGSNGRVYTLGWKAVDNNGEVTEGECLVSVPHDQSGRAAIEPQPPEPGPSL